MKKKLISLAIVILVIALFAVSPLYPYVKSLAAMKVYSYINEKESLMDEKGIQIQIPGGNATKDKDWYPFVMTYNADAQFQSFTGDRDARLTIMYNFPAFDMRKGCSLIYDETSPYYNGFYGAYAADGKFGFDENGNFNTDEASIVPKFDMQKLVLEDMGMPRSQSVFEWSLDEVKENINYAGYDGWTRVDAEMVVNGVLHRAEEDYRNYIQYGRPKYEAEENFAPVSMKGRIYARYFEEQDVSIYFYIMARNEEVLESCDRDILSESVITS